MTYRVAKTHKIPYLYRSFSAKVCKSDLYLVALLWKMACNLGDPTSLRHPVDEMCLRLSVLLCLCATLSMFLCLFFVSCLCFCVCVCDVDRMHLRLSVFLCLCFCVCVFVSVFLCMCF